MSFYVTNCSGHLCTAVVLHACRQWGFKEPTDSSQCIRLAQQLAILRHREPVTSTFGCLSTYSSIAPFEIRGVELLALDTFAMFRPARLAADGIARALLSSGPIFSLAGI